MKGIIQFTITKGDRYFVAQGVDLPIVTQGETLDELTHNIREAVDLALENENASEFGLTPTPSVLVNFEHALMIDIQPLMHFVFTRCLVNFVEGFMLFGRNKLNDLR
ncbi:type II toxin-antitoxin system HicB family antitoxin [bacterium]|nr:type II toxin-antitoxin system HicB family antitoxin [bacterium]MCI0680407.1 type II toxin-antitoxin system HicB family antitoxin [bacterium]